VGWCMVPQLLRISQFLCYRQPVELDFRGMHVACLCGENGAGKSALLDAITWALWGKARANDQDLISLGGTETRVELTFSLNGREFRVIRRRSAAAPGSAAKGVLELHARDGERWHVLTEGGMRQTQERLNRLLGIDYETFVNSAFLLQGRADAFTRKTPAERKQVLGDILNLQIYDLCQKYAREQARAIEAQLAEGEREGARLRQLVDQLPELEAAATQQHAIIQQQEARRDDLQQRYESLAQAVRALEHLAELAADRRERLKNLQTEAATLQARRAERAQRLAIAKEILARAEEITQQYQALQEARNQLQELNEQLRQRQGLLVRQQELRTLLTQEVACVERELHAVEQQLARFAQDLQHLPALEQEIVQLASQYQSLADLDSQRDAIETTIQTTHAKLAELQAQCEQLKAQGQQLKQQLRQLNAIGATCPVCLRPLDQADRERLMQELNQHGQELNAEYRQKQAEIANLKAELQRLEAERNRVRQDLSAREQLQQRLLRLQERVQLMQQQREQQSALAVRADELRQQLQSGTLGQAYRDELRQIQEALAAIPYDEATHLAAQAKVRDLADAEARYHDLLQKAATIEQEERELCSLTEQLEHVQQDIDALVNELSGIEQQLTGLAPLRAQMNTLAEELNAVDLSLREAHAELGRIEQRLADARQGAEQLEVLERAQQQLRDDLQSLDVLVRAFGRDGIQAMIIEDMLPELEERANAILDRMPGNTMRLSFRTQRPKRTDNQLTETLDIIISDELGQRPYELYSGGEAFRLNFAIRVALSMLLAHRAGTRLETLVIDEGFGSQDAKGREGIVQALRAVEDEFALILVITHLEELKDLFPTRITVVKTVEGSQIYVN